jgi:hypothetical protein
MNMSFSAESPLERIDYQRIDIESQPHELTLGDHRLQIVDPQVDLSPAERSDLNPLLKCLVIDPRTFLAGIVIMVDLNLETRYRVGTYELPAKGMRSSSRICAARTAPSLDARSLVEKLRQLRGPAEKRLVLSQTPS